VIIGKCPYDDCDEQMWNCICDDPPKFQRLVCEKCGRVIWLYHSRIDPVAYTEKGFFEKYDLNEATKSIKEKAKK